MIEDQTKESDQAKELRKLLSDIERPELTRHATQYETVNKPDTEQKIDVLNLPARKEIHSGKSNRMKIKVKKPYIRVVVVVLLIITLFAGGFYMWGEELIKIIQHI